MTSKVVKELEKLKNPKKVPDYQRFFKTAKGEYGEGDVFWGISVPQIRSVANKFKDTSLEDISTLLKHEVHEVRLCGLIILTIQYKNNPDKVYKTYMNNLKGINNWDLVDVSAPKIVGAYLFDKNRDILTTFAKSDNLWKKRVAIISTLYFIKQKDYEDTFKIAEILITDKHDLIHKAVGWMLREVGKCCGQDIEKQFLEKYTALMPRTMLRYAIEKFNSQDRYHFLNR